MECSTSKNNFFSFSDTIKQMSQPRGDLRGTRKLTPGQGKLFGLAILTGMAQWPEPTPREDHRREWYAKRRHQVDPRGTRSAVPKLSPRIFGGQRTHYKRHMEPKNRWGTWYLGIHAGSNQVRGRGPRTSGRRARVWEWLRKVTHDGPWKRNYNDARNSRGGYPSPLTSLPPHSMVQSFARARPSAIKDPPQSGEDQGGAPLQGTTLVGGYPPALTEPVLPLVTDKMVAVTQRSRGGRLVLTGQAERSGEGRCDPTLNPASQYREVSHLNDGGRDARGPKKCALTSSAVMEICRTACIGTHLCMVFSDKRLATHTWTGKVTHVYKTFVSVCWNEYPDHDLFLPVPENARITVLELRIDQSIWSTDKAPRPEAQRRTLEESAGVFVGYGARLKRQWENLEALDRSLKEWGRRMMPEFTPLPWKAPEPDPLRPPREDKMGKGISPRPKACGGGTVPLEAPRSGNHRRGMNPTRVPVTYREHRCCDGCQGCRSAWDDLLGKETAARIAEAMLRLRPAFPEKKMLPRVNPAFPGKGELTLGGDDPTEPTFVFSSGTTTVGWKSGGERLVRAPEPRVERNAGILGQIVKNTIDIAAVLELDQSGEAAEVVNILLSLSAFESQVKPGFQPQTRISRFMAHHAPALTAPSPENPTASGLFQETPRDFETNYMPLFTVPKKDETLRLIQDDRHLNEWFSRPPSMNLPRIHEVIDTLMMNEFFAQADAKSWFYQIPLHPDTYKYFGAILGGGRGSLIYGVMTKLPMGFSWAPCIAQRISNVIMRGIGLAWVDNYIVMGKTVEEFTANRSTFLDRISEGRCNVVVDNEALEPVRVGETLGVEVDLETKKYRMSPKWARKVAELGIPQSWTPRTFSKTMGGIIRCSHVTRRGLCMQPHLMSVLGDVMRRIALRQVNWDDECHVTDEAMKELHAVVGHIEENAWIQWRERGPQDMDIWADASDTHAAYLILKDQEVIAALVRETRGEHIFLEELSIALDAVAEAHRLGAERVRLFDDNAAAAGCIEKNVSTNFVANTRLRARAPVQVDVTWVSTKTMLADPYTRGVRPPALHSATWDLVLYNAAAENPELRKKGHHTFQQIDC